MSVWYENTTKQSKSQHGKKQRLGGPVSWNCNLISKFEVWQVRSHVNTDCSGISVVLRTYWAPYWMQHIPCQKKDHFRQLLAQAGLHFLILHPSGQGSQKMQWSFFFLLFGWRPLHRNVNQWKMEQYVCNAWKTTGGSRTLIKEWDQWMDQRGSKCKYVEGQGSRQSLLLMNHPLQLRRY